MKAVPVRCFALRSTPSSPFLLLRVRQGPGFASRLGPGNPLTHGVGQGSRPEGPPERDRDWSALSPQTLPRVKVADPDAPSSPPPGAGALPLFAHPGPPCPTQAAPGDPGWPPAPLHPDLSRFWSWRPSRWACSGRPGRRACDRNYPSLRPRLSCVLEATDDTPSLCVASEEPTAHLSAVSPRAPPGPCPASPSQQRPAKRSLAPELTRSFIECGLWLG